MPTAGATFNDPNGSRSQQTALMDQIIGAVNNVPAGSIIRVVAYSFDYQPVADALIAAKKRGAQVRLLIDSHAETAQIRQLRSAFGTGTSDGTYLRTCKYSCMANTPSFIHSKLYLFSRTGGATPVSMNSSANPAETGVSKSWNNTYTTVGRQDPLRRERRQLQRHAARQDEHQLLPHRGQPSATRSTSSRGPAPRRAQTRSTTSSTTSAALAPSGSRHTSGRVRVFTWHRSSRLSRRRAATSR